MTKELGNVSDKDVFETHLEEYRTLRTEILQRLEFQHRITNYAVALFVGILTAIVSIIGSGIIDRNQYFIILIIPLIFYFFAFAYREQDFMIIKMAEYINSKLKPKIENLLDVEPGIILGWDKFLRHKTKWSLFVIFRGNIRYIFLFLLNFIFILTFYMIVDFELTNVERIIVVIDILMFIDPVVVTLYIHRKYEEIIKDEIIEKV